METTLKTASKKAAPSTVRLTPEGMSIWEQLAARKGLSRTAYLEMTLRELAQGAGISHEAEREARRKAAAAAIEAGCYAVPGAGTAAFYAERAEEARREEERFQSEYGSGEGAASALPS